jgi:hypothetical protein
VDLSRKEKKEINKNAARLDVTGFVKETHQLIRTDSLYSPYNILENLDSPFPTPPDKYPIYTVDNSSSCALQLGKYKMKNK